MPDIYRPYIEHPEIKHAKPFQAIVVMPYSSREHIGGKESKIDADFGLTYESKLSAIAALEAYKKNQADKIILVGEDTVGSNKKYSTVDFMKELLMANRVPEQAIEVHRDLQNTVEQLGKVSELQGSNDRFLIVSLGFHTPRVKIVAENKRIAAEHESAEQLLERRSAHYSKPLKTWGKSIGMKKAKIVEAVLRPISRVDIQGSFQKWLTDKLGTRKPLTDFPRQRRKPRN